MMLEFLRHLIELDFGWIVQFILNNLLWLFLFAALSHFLFEGKKFIRGIIVFSVVVWTWLDFTAFIGWEIYVAGYLCLYYVLDLVFLKLTETHTGGTAKSLIYTEEVLFIGSLVVFNLFLKGVL
jgi:hypothetical protein